MENSPLKRKREGKKGGGSVFVRGKNRFPKLYETIMDERTKCIILQRGFVNMNAPPLRSFRKRYDRMNYRPMNIRAEKEDIC